MDTVERPRDEPDPAVDQTTPAERAEAATGDDDAWARPTAQSPVGEAAEAERARLLGEDGGPDEPTPNHSAQEPAAVRQEPAAVRQEPAAVRQEPAAVRQETAAVRQEPAAVRQEPAAVRQEPAAVRQEPAAVRQEPAAVRQETAAVRQEPAAVRQEPAAVRQEPAAVRQEPAAARQEPAERAGVGPEDYPEATRLPSLDALRGLDVCDPDDHKIGTVEDAYLDRDGAYVRYLAVKAAGIGGRRHVVPIDDVRDEERDGDRYLRIPYAKDQLEAGPAFESDQDLTPGHEAAIYGYYGRIGYWDRARELLAARQAPPAPTPEIAEAELNDAIAHGEDLEGVRVTRWDG